MTDTRKSHMRLNILKGEDAKVLLHMKSKKVPPLVAKVGDFLFDEEDTKVVVLRCE